MFFWDIAGQDEFSFMRKTFYSGSKACIIVFSLEESDLGKTSYESITKWHEDIKKHSGDLPIVLFGNKVDLVDEKNLDDENIQKLVKERGFLGYYKTSAKTGVNVFSAFQAIIKTLYHKYKEE